MGPGGRFGATLAVKDRRLVEAGVTLRETDAEPPAPGFAGPSIRAISPNWWPDGTTSRRSTNWSN